MALTVVIVNYNSKDLLRSCLLSIERYEKEITLQIIVVDGGSYDGCAEMLAEDFPYVEFIQSPENIGFGRCNNLGVSKAKWKNLLLLNPDTEFTQPILNSMLKHFESLPRAGILCPRLLLSDGTLQMSSVQSAPTPLNQALGSEYLQKLFPDSRLWGSGEAYRSKIPVAVEAVSGAFMLIKTDVYRKVGGFNPAYFMYAEDMDLCLQVRKMKLVNYHIPDLSLLHHGGGSSTTQFSQYSIIMMRESLYIYMKLNHGLIVALAYRIGILVSGISRCFITGISQLIKNSPDKKITIKKWSTIISWSLGWVKYN